MLAFAWLVSAGRTSALESAALVAESPLAQKVLSSRYIRVDGQGKVAIAYGAALSIFARASLLDDIQAEYVRALPAGTAPEFVVQQFKPGEYAYANKSGETSEIRELYRGATGSNTFDVIYHVQGRRFFGYFQSLIHVEITPADAQNTRYEVVVYAYPESALPRFFARHLGLIERYFHRKTAEIEALATRICTGLGALDPQDALARLAPEPAMRPP